LLILVPATVRGLRETYELGCCAEDDEEEEAAGLALYPVECEVLAGLAERGE
jgi:hypothetical protein